MAKKRTSTNSISGRGLGMVMDVGSEQHDSPSGLLIPGYKYLSN